MIVIQGCFEGNIVAEEQLADTDDQFTEALVADLYASGCDYVHVIQG